MAYFAVKFTGMMKYIGTFSAFYIPGIQAGIFFSTLITLLLNLSFVAMLKYYVKQIALQNIFCFHLIFFD